MNSKTLPLLLAVIVVIAAVTYGMCNRASNQTTAAGTKHRDSLRTEQSPQPKTQPIGENGRAVPSILLVYSACAKLGTRTDWGYYSLFMRRFPGNGKPVQLTHVKGNESVRLGYAAWYPVFSPDGRKVLFLGSRYPQINDPLIYDDVAWRTGLDLFLCDIGSKKLQQLTNDGAGYFEYVWSADSKQIAAIVRTAADDSLHIIDAANGQRRELIRYKSSETGIGEVRLSGRLQDVMFTRYPVSSGAHSVELCATPLGGSITTTLFRGEGNPATYSVSPDGKHVAFLADDAVHVAAMDGSASIVVVKGPNDGRYWPVWGTRPEWLPDGRRLALAETIRGPKGRFDPAGARFHIYDLSSRQDKVVAKVDHGVEAVRASRNGHWLLATTWRRGTPQQPKNGGLTCHGLVAVSVDDGRKVVVKEPDQGTKGLDWVETP